MNSFKITRQRWLASLGQKWNDLAEEWRVGTKLIASGALFPDPLGQRDGSAMSK
jgi:hypothetical protein